MASLGIAQIKKFTTWAPEMSTVQHIKAWYDADPVQGEKIIATMLDSQHRRSAMSKLLESRPIKYFDNDEMYFWELVSAATSVHSLLEARDETGNVVTTTSSMIGAHNAPFTLVFGEQAYFDGETIMGSLNEAYPMVVLGPGRQEGTNVAYTVQLSGSNIDGIPAERLLPGEKFSHMANFVEYDLSRQVGGLRFGSNSKMRNEWSMVRLYHEAGGALVKDDTKTMLNCTIPFIREDNGKRDEIQFFMKLIENEFDYQFDKQITMAQLHGVSNRNANGQYTVVGKSGNVVKTGDGLYELIRKGSRIRYYNKFNLNLLTEELSRICMAANLPMTDREFVVTTGTRGLELFHEAVEQQTSGWSANVQINADNLGMVNKTSADFATNALAAGYQYTEYRGPNHVVIKVTYDPHYDDPEYNKLTLNGYPVNSARMDIMDIGTPDVPNVQLTRLRGDEPARGYLNGLRNPFTKQSNINYMATDKDASSMHRMSGRFGVMLVDPTRVVSLIPQMLQY